MGRYEWVSVKPVLQKDEQGTKSLAQLEHGARVVVEILYGTLVAKIEKNRVLGSRGLVDPPVELVITCRIQLAMIRRPPSQAGNIGLNHRGRRVQGQARMGNGRTEEAK